MSKYIVKCKKAYLKSTLSTTATSVVLRKLVDSKDNNVTLANFGSWGVIVIKQGDTIEMIKFDAISTASDDTATLTVATNGRNINPTTPYAGSGTGLAFTSGAEVIVTNDPLTLAQLANLNLANTWALLQTFTVIPQSADVPTVGNDLINKTYADALVLGALTTINVVVPATAGETVSAGQLVYFDTTDNEWKLCDADTASTVENVLLAITQGAGTNGNAISGGVILRGLDSNQSGMTQGEVMYASNTAGAIANSAGTKEVTIGIAKSATTLYFNPRFNQQLTEDQQDALAGKSGTTPSATNLFIDEADVVTTVTASKVVRRKSDGSIAGATKFGGDGTDGALDTSGGTVNINLGNASIVVKNYTSINVATNNLTFTNPHANGTKIILKSQGNVTISATIDASGMGASATTNANEIVDDTAHNGADGAQSTNLPTNGGSTILLKNLYATSESILETKSVRLLVGSGGGAGGSATGAGGAGGKGGGALLIECSGALVFTGTVDVSGKVGSAGTDNTTSAGGGGGGGAGGSILILANTITTNSGTLTIAGGNGGAGGDSTSTSGTGGQGGGGAGAYAGAGGAGGRGGGSGGTWTASDGSNGAGSTGGTGGISPKTANQADGGGGGGGAEGFSLVILNSVF